MNIMKNGALFLLIILVLGLILAPFLGGSYREGYTDKATESADKVTLASGVTASGKHYDHDNTDKTDKYNKYKSHGYDNYDHYSKSSAPTTYYGPNGAKANVSNNDGKFTIVVTGSNGETTTYTTASPMASTMASKSSSTGSDSISSLMKQFGNTTFYGPNGGSARFFTGTDGQYAIEVTKSNGNTTIYTATNTYTYNYTGSNVKESYTASPFTNTRPEIPSSNSNYNSNSSNNNDKYSSVFPQGIPRIMIPPGQEDLYILKSEIVPPVCPACPSASACPSNKTEKCPPCPACARCPEPSFECKKVPNYNSTGDNSYLPIPVLSDFSTFGM
jgi:hypothetical protein